MIKLSMSYNIEQISIIMIFKHWTFYILNHTKVKSCTYIHFGLLFIFWSAENDHLYKLQSWDKKISSQLLVYVDHGLMISRQCLSTICFPFMKNNVNIPFKITFIGCAQNVLYNLISYKRLYNSYYTFQNPAP